MKPTQFVATLAKHGNFDDGQIAYLGRLAEDFEKNSSSPTFVDFLKGVAPQVLGILGTSAVSGLIGYSVASKRYKELHNSLQYSHQDMLSKHPAFHSNPEVFTQRFNELSLISPTVAANPSIAHKIILPKLKNGFNLEDIHRLAAIEHHTSTSPRPAMPGSVLAAEGIEGLNKILGFLTPSVGKFHNLTGQLAHTQAAAHEYAKKHEEGKDLVKKLHTRFEEVATNYNKLVDDHESLKNVARAVASENDALKSQLAAHQVPPQEKTSMEHKPQISEECLGVMLADRYLMYKKAGLLKTAGGKGIGGDLLGRVGEMFRPSADAVTNHFKLLAIPLALSMGVQAVRTMMKQKETADMREQAEKTFGVLKRQSEYIKSNPEVANEAFDALRSFAPTLATKPLIAKTFIEHVIKTDQLAPQTAQELANAEDKVQQIAETTGGGSFLAGLQEPLSIFKMKMPGADEHKPQRRTSGGGKVDIAAIRRATSSATRRAIYGIRKKDRERG